MNKIELLSQIAKDMQLFCNFMNGDEVDTFDKLNMVSFSSTGLGRWLTRSDKSMYYFNWDDGEYNKYMKKFDDWAKTKTWYQYIKLKIEINEKKSVSFQVIIKPEFLRDNKMTKLSNLVDETLFNLDETDNKGSMIDGLTKEQAKRFIYKNIDSLYNGKMFKDEYWQPIHSIFKFFKEVNIDFSIEKTQYFKNEQGAPQRKEWDVDINFIEKNNRPAKIFCKITASGAGSIQDPLDMYDVTVVLS